MKPFFIIYFTIMAVVCAIMVGAIAGGH